MLFIAHILLFIAFSTQAFSEEINELPYSAPEQIVSLTQVNGKIGGIINPLSGQPCLRQTDLIAKGAQDIVLKRIFISQHRDWYANQALLLSKGFVPPPQKIESGWVIFPNIYLDHTSTIEKRKHHSRNIKNEVRLVDQNGVAITFALSLNGKAQLIDKPYGICNSNSLEEMPSGQYDPRNTKIYKKDNTISVHLPHGSIYHYTCHSTNVFNDKNNHTETEKSHYILFREVLPNGKVLRYRYNKKRELVQIESKDPQEHYTYASMNIESSSTHSTSKFSTNTGLSAAYQQNPSRQFKNTHAIRKDNRALNILSISSVKTPYYANEMISLDKTLLDTYSGRRYLFACQYDESGENQAKNKRVSKLLISEDGTHFHPVHEFSYTPPLIEEKPGKTVIKNIDGSFVVYKYSSQLLLKAIKSYDASSVLKMKKKFYWSADHWLSRLSVYDGNNYLLYKKEYHYDKSGNPVLEVFSGDITGGGVYDNIATKREFSKDGRHLLLEEKSDEGKILSFQYLPNTNLILTKFIKNEDRILIREFYEYDDCNNLIKKIEDNGITENRENLSGVSQRRITNYILRNTPPFLHLPEWVEEKYLENGSEKLLKRSHLSYDTHGNVCEENIFDADGIRAYTLYKSYDERGLLVSQTNAIGQQAVYTYSDKGHCIYSTNFSKSIQKKMDYDQRDRLIKIEEVGSDQIIHSTSFVYDLNDNLTRKVDSFQNVIDYCYDPLCHKITQTCSPAIAGIDGKIIPVNTSSIYDSFGRELSKTDANGNITTYRYAGHHLPIEIIHPDGSKESFSYTRTGLLKDHIDQEGLTTSFSYDALNRVICKIYSTKNEEIARESFVYDSFNLLKKIDREGNTTSYGYDGAGRLISEETSGKVINSSYDALGRLKTAVNHNGKNSLFTHYKNDLLDRVIEKQCCNADDKILSKINYTYDPDGNLSAITRNINGHDTTEVFTYDSFQRQTNFVDALGIHTKTIYNENFVNSLGQKVLQTIKIDAKNKSVIQTEDSYGRIVQEDMYGPGNSLIASQKMAYDSIGNLVQKKNLIFRKNQYQKTLETQWTYTSNNKVSTLTRAANSSDSRITRYLHTPKGKQSTKIKPDGSVISYTYDPLGYLESIKSIDGKLKLAYKYNRLGDLIQALDENTHISVHRNLDPYGNITAEKLSTGLTIEKTYDAFDRPLSLMLHDQGHILYDYDPMFLRSVSRISLSGNIVYQHKYTDYDSSGYLQKENLIGNLGNIDHSVDAKGRKTLIICPYFAEKCRYDEVDNIVEIETNGLKSHNSYDGLDQLTTEDAHSCVYDSNYNRVEEDGTAWTTNELDELLSTAEIQCSYDLNGNLISKKSPSETISFAYDPLDRLIQVITNEKHIEMVYDPLGRRLSKIIIEKLDSNKSVENYLYDGENDIGAYNSEGLVTQLRVLGLAYHKDSPSTIAIELEKQVFAPIQDFQGNIRCLISSISGKNVNEYHFNAFGKQKFVSEEIFNPWRYASKRFDQEINFTNFGKRYYDADLNRWTTLDPAGFIDGMNLYAYAKNNPYRYSDPNGLFVLPLMFFVPAIVEVSFAGIVSWISVEAIGGILLGTALGIGVYQLDKALDDNERDISLNNEAVSEEVETEKKKKKSGTRQNVADTYAPDRELPQTEDGIPIPDADAPHTQLGTRDGNKGKHPKAREFDGGKLCER